MRSIRAMMAFLVVLLMAGCACERRIEILGADSTTCPDVDPDVPELPTDCLGGAFTVEIPNPYYVHVDVLVVIDNSISMREEQASLAASFPYFIQSLLNPPIDPGTGLPRYPPVRDLHLGVISTDMGTGGYSVETCSDPIDGDNGELLHTPSSAVTGCEPAYPTYLSYVREEPDVSEIDRLCTAFGCIATLGINGCGWEQPFAAARWALIHHRDGANAGFLRPDSLLVILFLTDEEDCSVAPGNEGIFDTLDSTLGHLNLRCFHHPYMIEPIDAYISAFHSLRVEPSKIFLAFIVGVPPGEQCEGSGNTIPTCNDHPDMFEQVDPVTMTRLVPSCVGPTDEAYPARRFVRLAQEFGEQAYVRSICTDDLLPAIHGLTGKIQEHLIERHAIAVSVEAVHDVSDPCRCVIPCRAIEMLLDHRSCSSVGKACYESGGPGTGCAEPVIDEHGLMHSLCEIPQAGTRMAPCSSGSARECNDSYVTHAVDRTGWYYIGRGWTDDDGLFYSEPVVRFTAGMEPYEGSDVYLSCCY